jgi:hypothetical protein
VRSSRRLAAFAVAVIVGHHLGALLTPLWYGGLFLLVAALVHALHGVRLSSG